MIQAPLQLVDYWVNSIEVRASTTFDSKSPVELDASSIDVVTDVQPIPAENTAENGTSWRVVLRLEQAFAENKNIPYSFALDMVGIVAAHPDLTNDRLDRAVQVNGPSMLFGVAREILRAATGRGPYAPLIIPSTHFLQRMPSATPSPELPNVAESGN
jgi:preprotein translocase subunit SecB